MRERFFKKVDTSGGPDACHPWTGRLSRNGRGQFSIGARKKETASRVAFFLEHGRWPEPCALHTCDNPPCCNVRHLFEGTQADNLEDMARKGRNNRKIDGADVALIRMLLGLGARQKCVAGWFSVSPPLVSMINTGAARNIQ